MSSLTSPGQVSPNQAYRMQWTLLTGLQATDQQIIRLAIYVLKLQSMSLDLPHCFI